MLRLSSNKSLMYNLILWRWRMCLRIREYGSKITVQRQITFFTAQHLWWTFFLKTDFDYKLNIKDVWEDQNTPLRYISSKYIYIKTIGIFRTLSNFKYGVFLRQWLTEAVHYFHIKLHIRCLTGFWICIWLVNTDKNISS